MTHLPTRLGTAGGAIVACLCLAHTADARQAVRPLPSREQIERPNLDRPVAERETIEIRDERTRTPCLLADSTLEADLRRVRFVGPDGASPPTAVAELLAGVRVSPGVQPLANLCDVRDAATELLRDRGYIAAVTLAPQTIAQGEALLTVVTARLVGVEVKGEIGPYQDNLNRRIAQLKAIDPLNSHDVERVLLLAQDTPGLQATLALRNAGGRPGEVIGELSVRYTPFQVVAHADNYGAKSTGRESGVVRVDLYGLGGAASRTYLGVSSTFDGEEQRVVQVGHSTVVTGDATLGARLAYAWTRPDAGPLDLRSKSWIAGLDIGAPLVREVRRNLTLGAGLEAVDQRLRLETASGATPLTKDKLRVAYVRLSGGLRAPRTFGGDLYTASGSLELRKGLDVLDATKQGVVNADGSVPSRIDGDPQALVLRGAVSGVLNGPRGLSLTANVQGQWTDTALLSAEEYAVGNLTIGRGYDPGITAGDRAVAARIEPRAVLPINARAAAQVYAFYDAVTIWNDDRFTLENDRLLRSWGLGARLFLPRGLVLDASWADPIDPGVRYAGARDAPQRLLLSLTAQF